MIKSAYIHIPFCRSICSYCDFCKFYYHTEMVDKYLNTLKNEINKRYHGEVIETLYIGGGTPSCLSKRELRKLFDLLRIFKTNNLEYTIECNIEDITEEKLKLFKEYGINRLSIGIQSFNDEIIKFLKRNHTKDDVIAKVSLAHKYFNNINIDLIYAIPGQTLEDLRQDLDIVLSLDVEHISTYSLIIEPHTFLSIQKIENIDDELDYEMYKLICQKLKDYEHYEISNFGKIKSRHNLTYWNNEEYYGFGLGASGYIDSIRYENTKSFNKYIKEEYCKESVIQTLKMKIQNEFILGLRKMEGINIDEFEQKYNLNITDVHMVKELILQGKLKLENRHLFIAEEYWYLSNDILLNFVD